MGIKNMPKNLQDSEKSTTFALANEKYRGVEQLVARQAHNLEVGRFSYIHSYRGADSKAQIYIG